MPLDATLLNAELESLLLARWQQVCGNMGKFIDPKVSLRAAILYLSSLSGDAGPGEVLLRLHRAAALSEDMGTALELPLDPGAVRRRGSMLSASRRLLYGCLVVLLPCAWARLSKHLAASDASEHPHHPRWLKAMQRAEGAVALGTVLASLRFLCRGGSPTLPMLLVGLHLVPSTPGAALPPAFEFMEQQVRAPANTRQRGTA